MRMIHARNVNDAFTVGVRMLLSDGFRQPSRVGEVLTMGGPVTTTYECPRERVLFHEARDANPFFHLMESLWMLAGRDDVKWISEFSSGISQFSDDGVSFHGAYGFRWRNHFDFDQLKSIQHVLEEDPNSRRAILGMWDPNCDLGGFGKDYPCNLSIAFRIRHERLDMTVFNRSNDIIWGAYGANAVHMSVLQEILAGLLGVKVGCYYQVSNDYHAYVDVIGKLGDVQPHPMCPYDNGTVRPHPMVDDPGTWFVDLQNFMEGGLSPYHNQFFGGVAGPMRRAWYLWKDKSFLEALQEISTITAPDWRFACDAWIRRRYERYVQADKSGGTRTKVAYNTGHQ